MTSTLTLPLSASRSRPALDFDALYRSARDDVFAYVATMLRDHAAAEDVTAAAFERAYRKQRSFNAAKGSERAWIFGIARNAALDELRSRKRTAAMPVEPADTRPDHAEQVLDRAVLQAAMATLAPRDREVIALRYHAGLGTSELAGVLGTTPSNAGTLLHRAMTKLREAMHA